MLHQKFTLKSMENRSNGSFFSSDRETLLSPMPKSKHFLGRSEDCQIQFIQFNSKPGNHGAGAMLVKNTHNLYGSFV